MYGVPVTCTPGKYQRITGLEIDAFSREKMDFTLKELLEEAGHEVIGEAADGLKAVEMTRKLKPDLVIMDISLEGPMDGVAAAAILIAASSNNLVKGVYAYSLSDRKTGVLSLSLLAGLAAAGLTPLLWLAR